MENPGQITVEGALTQIHIESGFTLLTLEVDWSEIEMWWRYAMGELEEAEGSFGKDGTGAVFIVPSDDHTIFRVDADGVQQTVSVLTEVAQRGVKRSLGRLAPKRVLIDDGATCFSFLLPWLYWSDWRFLAEGTENEVLFEGADIFVHLRIDGGLAILTCSGSTFHQELYFLAWLARESIARSLSA